MNRRALWLVLMSFSMVWIAVLGGCDSCNNQPITVTLSTPPPASIPVNGTATIAATVLHDSRMGGVTWSCTPGNSLATCGSFSSTTTASGATTIYTAPPGAGSVTITATSVTNPMKTASATVTVNAVAITISTPPPASMALNNTASIVATVTNDVSNGGAGSGVDWTCTVQEDDTVKSRVPQGVPPPPACGSFSPTHTASGAATTYTAPGVPTNVTITATATVAPNPSATVNVTVQAVGNITVSISSPPPTSMVVSTTADIAATVSNDSTPTPMVTWSCTPGNSLATCGSFSASPTASGAFTTFTAPPTVPAGGTVTITATSVTDNLISASVTVTIMLVPKPENFSFYMSGLENINIQNAAGNFYALAGSVTIDVNNGPVLAGEQDYNDAIGLTSPQPSGDSITGGNLAVDATTGAGTLTVITNNSALGVNGTETFAVQFVNANHALISQFDGSATSSGSLDLQTLPSTPSGSFAFDFSGVDNDYDPIVLGGVFTLTGNTMSAGTFDFNDSGNVVIGVPVAGTLSAADSFGRGTITNFPIATTINYYIVGPEVIRLIDMDAVDSGVGSAFGQGTAAFSNASLGASVLGFASNSFGIGDSLVPNLFAVAGQLTTNSGAGTISGVADNDEDGTITADIALNGVYSIGTNGYGSLSLSSGGTCNGTLQDVCLLGVYMTDPALNINDPNNTTTNLGGALIVDLDPPLQGTGFAVPQTDTATASFAGNYAFGAQDFNDIGSGNGWEFDFLGNGAFAGSFVAAPGVISDPFTEFGLTTTIPNATFSMTPLPDLASVGRYHPGPLAITPAPPAPNNPFLLQTVIYQANGGMLLWVNLNDAANSIFSTFGGTLQQQAEVVTPLPSAKVGSPSGTKVQSTTKPKQ
jgi:hypothetical protein